MPNLFEGTQPPEWLQQRALRQPDMQPLGDMTAGLVGGFSALAKGKPFMQGFSEGQMAHRDPEYRLKIAQMQLRAAAAITKMEADRSRDQTGTVVNGGENEGHPGAKRGCSISLILDWHDTR